MATILLGGANSLSTTVLLLFNLPLLISQPETNNDLVLSDDGDGVELVLLGLLRGDLLHQGLEVRLVL